MGSGVNERYGVGGDGLLLGLGGEWAKGSLEAEQGQKGKVNHDVRKRVERVREGAGMAFGGTLYKPYSL